MARQRSRKSRAARNQAKWDSHARTTKTPVVQATSSDVMPGLGAYAGGKAPVLNTGSIQASPRQPSVTPRRGIKLQPFSDVIPSVPADYATVKANHLTQDKQVWARIDRETRKKCTAPEDKCEQNHGDKCIMGRVWQGTVPDRKMMDFERVKLAVRPSHESAMMAADRPSGAENFKTHAERHDDDKRAGLYRDGLGRIMRTVDMDDPTDGAPVMMHDWRESDPVHLTCEVDEVTRRVRIMVVNERTGERQPRGKVVMFRTEGVMTTTDYAQMHGVPIQRNTTQKRHAAAKEKALKAEARAAKKAQKDQERAARAAHRAERMTSRPSRAEARAEAVAYLIEKGVPESAHTPALIKAAREALDYKAQVQSYVDGNKVGA